MNRFTTILLTLKSPAASIPKTRPLFCESASTLAAPKPRGWVLDPDNAEIVRRRYPKPPNKVGIRQIFNTIVSLVDELQEHAGTPCRVGIGTPGHCHKKPDEKKTPIQRVLNNEPLQADLSALLKREIRMENDANCFAFQKQ
ncbi:MAG: hypothetical protein CM1200mP41_11420 [Gammaproteobacteria bacterium]|nr:MAG: hypothetical protein CM1200mP41_11420 [Gammaproteobacteria bacterium]